MIDELAGRIGANAGSAGNVADTFDSSFVLQTAGRGGGGAVLGALIGGIARAVRRMLGRSDEPGSAQTGQSESASPYPNNTNDPSQLVRPPEASSQPTPPASQVDPAAATVTAAGTMAAAAAKPTSPGTSQDQQIGNERKELLQRLTGNNYSSEAAVVEKVKNEQALKADNDSLMAVRHYTSLSFFRGFNRRTRESRDTPDDKTFAEMLQTGKSAFPEYAGPIHRAPADSAGLGNRFWDAAKVGEEFDLGRQFHSFSRHLEEAARRAVSSRLVVTIRNPTDAHLIESIAHFPAQGEVLLSPGSRFRVVRKDPDGFVFDGKKIRLIELEIVK